MASSLMLGESILAGWERRRAHARVEAPSVGLVLAGYDTGSTSSAVQALQRWIGDHPAPVTPCLVLNRRASVPAPGWTTVLGSNAAHEFSAYDEGVEAVRARARPQVWIFLNDRYDAYPGSGPEWFLPSVLHLIAHAPVLAGHEDRLSAAMLAGDPGEPPRYVRTNLFAVGDQLLSKLGTLTSHRVSEADALLPPGWPLAGPAGASRFTPAYLDAMRTWLTGRAALPGRPAGATSVWYRATDDPGRLDMLRAKAVCILNEHLLSRRVQQGGGLVHDVRRLYRMTGLLGRPGRLRRELARAERVSLDSRGERLRLLAAPMVPRRENARKGVSA
jgi:hypothetical protein